MAVIKYKNSNNWVNAALAFYPVGAIYLSYTNVTPADLFGGTWTAINNGYYMKFTAGNETGGNNSHTHGLSGGAAAILIDYNNTAKWGQGYMKKVSCAEWINTQFLTITGTDSSYTGRSFTSGAALVGNTDSTTITPAYQNVYAYRRTA